jgi:two-component system copper resistance phosphate regulon response regulator CusR
MRILIIEDYGPLRQAIAQRLREEAFQVDEAVDGEQGLHLARTNEYPLILLDLMLPDRDGMEVLSDLRARGSDTAVLIMTARDAVPERITGLDAGADDYLVKPFALDELMARVRVLIRRRYGHNHSVLVVGDLEIDLRKRMARRGGVPISLTAREFALLELLALRRGGLVTRREIWEQIYDLNYEAVSNVVDVYIAHLRKKIERPGMVRLIHTRRGEGYVLALPEETGASQAAPSAESALSA